MQCLLKDGILTFQDNEMRLFDIFSIFRKDLLSKGIPNYRPVGIIVYGSKSNDMVQVVKDISMSYLEAGFVTNNLVVSDKIGIRNKEFHMTVNDDEDFSFITYAKSHGEPGEYYITGKGMKNVVTLLNSFELFGDYVAASDAFTTDIVLYKGTGFRSFDDNYSLFNLTQSTFFPTTTDYALFNYFRLMPYGGEDYLKLNYTVDLNEEVLSRILNDYFGGAKFNVEG